MNFNDKVFLVIGAAGLLGRALVVDLLSREASVIAVDISMPRMKECFSQFLIGGRNSSSLELKEVDLSDPVGVENLFVGVSHIDGAVNCAYPRNKNYGKHFYDVEINDFNENVTLNLGSSFLFMQQSAKYFEKNKKAFSLVNISSVYGVVAPDFDVYKNTLMTMPVEYAAIKSGLIHLSKYVTKYVSSSDFRVNLVSPGGIFDQQPNDFLEAYKNKTFGEGMLDVTSVLGTIIFLLSPMSNFINGQNIIVDDGFSI